MTASTPPLPGRLNDLYPARGIFKDAGLQGTPGVDRKVPFDLSEGRLSALLGSGDQDLLAELGPDFQEVVQFFHAARSTLIPSLLKQCGHVLGMDLVHNHSKANFNLQDHRLLYG